MICSMTFWSFDTIGTGISVTWSPHHHQWHHCIPYVKKTKMRCNITFVLWLCEAIEISITRCKLHWSHVLPLTLVSASWDADDIINETIAVLRSKWSNEVLYKCFCHVDTTGTGIINGTTAFLRSRKLKWGAIWLF